VAFPTVAARATDINITSTTSQALDLPTGITAGDLLVVTVQIATGIPQTITWPSGWTQLYSQVNGVVVQGAAAYRVADGTEGSTVTITLSSNSGVQSVALRITGHDSATAPQAGTATTGTTSTPNPPSLTPTGGAKDYLWIACCVSDAANVTAAPTNYSNLTVPGSGSDIGTAERLLNAASEDPGTFTLASSNEWVANTIAVHPAAAVTASLVMMP
jgi:hypothetical protein